MAADPSAEGTGSRPGRLSALRDFTARFKPTFKADDKAMLLLRLVLFITWVGATLALASMHPFWAVTIFMMVMFFFGTVKVNEGNRGLPSLLGGRKPVSLPEGLKPVLPFLITVRSIDIRDHLTMVAVRHQSADGFFHDVKVAIQWHAPRSTDESGRWIDGRQLLMFDNLEPGVAERQVIALTEQAAEPTIASYAHDQLSGINVYQLVDKLKGALENGVSLDLGAIFSRDSAIALKTRSDMARQIHDVISVQLKSVGIVVSMVTMAVVNPDKTIVDLLEEIQRQFVEKSSQALDMAGDIQKALQFVEAAKRRDEDVTLLDAYRTIRDLDNRETAAKQGIPAALLERVTSLVGSKVA